MIEHQWQELIYCFDNIKLHEFIVMPNHFHGIIEFVGVPLVGTQNVEQPPTMGQPQGIAPTVGDVVGARCIVPRLQTSIGRIKNGFTFYSSVSKKQSNLLSIWW